MMQLKTSNLIIIFVIQLLLWTVGSFFIELIQLFSEGNRIIMIDIIVVTSLLLIVIADAFLVLNRRNPQVSLIVRIITYLPIILFLIGILVIRFTFFK